MKQVVRIIGGRFRGKKLSFPEVEGLRPTPDRVKETLFNWLMHTVRGARCLDAFAGSGSLGLEAFSRGATEVVLIEASAEAYRHLLKIASTFQAPEIQVKHANVLEYLSKEQQPYDLIFLDPPFSSDYLEPCLTLIRDRNLLHPQGILYIESASKLELDPHVFQCLRSKQAGQVFYAIFSLLSESKSL